MTDTTDTTPTLSVQEEATETYRVAWLTYAEAFSRAALMSRDGHVPAVVPRWQAALAERDAACEILRSARERFRESMLAIGCTEAGAAWSRSQIERSAREDLAR